MATLGIHHVTAIAGDAQENIDFYSGVLGLRLVKKTVNFDDPTRYHLYYGDGSGAPGSLLTFFPWGHAGRGRPGVGSVALVSLAIPLGSIGYWIERFVRYGVSHTMPARRFGETVLPFSDRDGLRLELVASAESGTGATPPGGTVPDEFAIRGVHGVTLWENALRGTQHVLMDALGLERGETQENTTRFKVPGAGLGAHVDVRVVHEFLAPEPGVGAVHHVAFRTPSLESQAALRERIIELGMHPTAVIDRKYFQSVYFREPGAVLFEIATDPPGFGVDEPWDALGRTLQLPLQFEPSRAELERVLPEVHEPSSQSLAYMTSSVGEQS